MTTTWEDDTKLRLEQAIAAHLGRIVDRLVPPRYVARIELEPAVRDWVEYAVEGGTDGLLLTGPTGVGKTHHAYAALSEVIVRRDWDTHSSRHMPRIEAESTPSLLARCRPGAEPMWKTDGMGESVATDPIDWFGKAKLLLLDDLGAEKPSEWTGEVLYRLIDYRYTYMLPTICVTNLPLPELGKTIGDRLASRLGQMCRTVVLKGNDRRRAR